MRLSFLILIGLLWSFSARAEMRAPLVVLPKDVRAGETLPVAVWLHGYGANPSGVVGEPLYQYTADRLHIAVVGVYATREIQEDAFEWSEEPGVDYAHVMDSLKAVEREKEVHFSKKVLFGFSQGACLAAELAVLHPEEFCGAIVLSPGAKELAPGPRPALEGNRKQLYYLSCGAGEAAGNVQYTRRYARYLAETGATVHEREVEGMQIHNRPPDWLDRFPEWVGAILSFQGAPAPSRAAGIAKVAGLGIGLLAVGAGALYFVVKRKRGRRRRRRPS